MHPHAFSLSHTFSAAIDVSAAMDGMYTAQFFDQDLMKYFVAALYGHTAPRYNGHAVNSVNPEFNTCDVNHSEARSVHLTKRGIALTPAALPGRPAGFNDTHLSFGAAATFAAPTPTPQSDDGILTSLKKLMDESPTGDAKQLIARVNETAKPVAFFQLRYFRVKKDGADGLSCVLCKGKGDRAPSHEASFRFGESVEFMESLNFSDKTVSMNLIKLFEKLLALEQPVTRQDIGQVLADPQEALMVCQLNRALEANIIAARLRDGRATVRDVIREFDPSQFQSHVPLALTLAFGREMGVSDTRGPNSLSDIIDEYVDDADLLLYSAFCMSMREGEAARHHVTINTIFAALCSTPVSKYHQATSVVARVASRLFRDLARAPPTQRARVAECAEMCLTAAKSLKMPPVLLSDAIKYATRLHPEFDATDLRVRIASVV